MPGVGSVLSALSYFMFSTEQIVRLPLFMMIYADFVDQAVNAEEIVYRTIRPYNQAAQVPLANEYPIFSSVRKGGALMYPGSGAYGGR